MKKRTYDKADLEQVVHGWEAEYGLPSPSVYEAYRREQDVAGVPRFIQHCWASFYLETLRLNGRMRPQYPLA